jgi:hypothetical protein
MKTYKRTPSTLKLLNLMGALHEQEGLARVYQHSLVYTTHY